MFHTQAAVNSVLKKAAEEKFKYEAAISFCRSKLSELRAEERRRVGTIYQYALIVYESKHVDLRNPPMSILCINEG